MLRKIFAALGAMQPFGLPVKRSHKKRPQTQDQRASALAAAEAKRMRRAERNKRLESARRH